MSETYYAVDVTVFWLLVAGCALGVLGGFWALALLVARLLGVKW